MNHSAYFPTMGPEHRYSAVLFIEKEGFAALLEAAGIAERFDIAIMSTKGMSTTAARMLLDKLSPKIEKVLVLHDFDVSGFSIFGTLRSSSRRYTFMNPRQIVDIGLRLTDVEEMGLQSEPVETSGSWDRRAETLSEHGATLTEISFLRQARVELNAMPSDVFVAFLERKLAEHGIHKMMPTRDILEQHARRVIEQGLADDVLRENQNALHHGAMSATLPGDLVGQVRHVLERRPQLSWDLAVAAIVRGELA